MARTTVSVETSPDNFNKIVLAVRGREIFFEPSTPVNPSYDFAIWAALPIAMRYGGVLQINGPTSEIAHENAEQLSIIWATWMPTTFRPVRVASTGFTDKRPPATNKALMLYSGGVDSTFALKRYTSSGNPKPDLLTIHGMDYHREDLQRFEELKDRTSSFRAQYAAESLEVRSNAASIMRRFGVSSAVGHGFQLFSTLFLFDETHDLGLISADFTAAQDYLTIPWGTNSLTNAFFAGNRMKIVTLSNDVTRGEKLSQLHADDQALQTLSFCKNYSVRPDNCGTCSKCVRTKAMFHAAGHEIPNIFRIQGFRAQDLRFLDLSKPIEVAFCMDVLRLARQSGRIEDFKFIQDQVFAKKRQTKLARLSNRIDAYIRGARANN